MGKALTPENKNRVIDVTKGSDAFSGRWIVGVDGSGENKS